jgi:hypothetical protein
VGYAVGKDLARIGPVADLGLDRFGRDLQATAGAVRSGGVIHSAQAEACAILGQTPRSYPGRLVQETKKLFALRITPTAIPSMTSVSRADRPRSGRTPGSRPQRDHAAAPAQALDRDLVGEACHDDLPGARFLRLVHCEQVAFQDADVAHRHARTRSR